MFAIYFPWLRHTPAFADTPGKIISHPRPLPRQLRRRLCRLRVYLIAVLHAFLGGVLLAWFVFGRLHRHVPLGVALVISGLAFMSHHVLVLGYYFPDYF